MKSRKIILIIFVVFALAMGLATLQDNIFDENQIVDVNESTSKVKTITVDISDGVGSGDRG